VLAPGIAAECAHWMAKLPLGVETAPAGQGLWWGCEVTLPPVTDPHTAPCLNELVLYLEQDVAARVGRAMQKPRTFGVRVWRKGSFADELSIEPGTVQAIVGLTGARWPAEWGGALEFAGEARPPGWNTLDLVESGARVSLLTHHVTMLTVVASY
jgi:hypothetical protein